MTAAKDSIPSTVTSSSSPDNASSFDLDALIIGAGFSDIAMLHRVRQLNLPAKTFEAGIDLGGT